MASCSDKGQDALTLEQDTLFMISEQRTKAITNAIANADKVIHEEEKRIEENLKTLKSEVEDLKINESRRMYVYIHDTVVIKEKTNFWGRKRISVDSITYVDSTEY